MSTDNGVIVRVSNLKKHYVVGQGFFGRGKVFLKAVDGINFEIQAGKTYGLVGESGCGKTTTAKMILLLEQPTEGEVSFDGENAFQFDREARKRYKASVQAVFQDPWSSLNPRIRVGGIVAEPLEVNSTMTRK